MEMFIKKAVQCHEDCIKAVLRQLLKREPTIEDAAKTHRLFKDGEINKYTLAYEGVELGVVQHNYPEVCMSPPMDYQYKFSVTFTPNQMFADR